ncbi:hypothetical protein GGS20DRAFT_565031 [Poronia punctata]|nr:hypothetical protein GGS20DRAFT_565031 [Poronia punctata]
MSFSASSTKRSMTSHSRVASVEEARQHLDDLMVSSPGGIEREIGAAEAANKVYVAQVHEIAHACPLCDRSGGEDELAAGDDAFAQQMLSRTEAKLRKMKVLVEGIQSNKARIEKLRLGADALGTRGEVSQANGHTVNGDGDSSDTNLNNPDDETTMVGSNPPTGSGDSTKNDQLRVEQQVHLMDMDINQDIDVPVLTPTYAYKPSPHVAIAALRAAILRGTLSEPSRPRIAQIWKDDGECERALRVHKATVGPRGFQMPAMFKYGIQYVPSPPTSSGSDPISLTGSGSDSGSGSLVDHRGNLASTATGKDGTEHCRMVTFHGLSPDTTACDVLDKVRGGNIERVMVIGGMASVIFVDAQAANAYAYHINMLPDGLRVGKDILRNMCLVATPTYPSPVLTPGTTRCLRIPYFPRYRFEFLLSSIDQRWLVCVFFEPVEAHRLFVKQLHERRHGVQCAGPVLVRDGANSTLTNQEQNGKNDDDSNRDKGNGNEYGNGMLEDDDLPSTESLVLHFRAISQATRVRNLIRNVHVFSFCEDVYHLPDPCAGPLDTIRG